MYKKILILSLLSILLPTGFPLVSLAKIEGNIDDIAKAILTYFPKVIGTVVSTEEETVVVDFGRDKGISEGLLLVVYRDKDPFYHPVTGAPLGNFEEVVGTVEVVKVEANRSQARRVHTDKEADPNRAARTGDKVRVPATRIPLAVTETDLNGEHFLTSELISALTDTGRFRIDLLPPQSTVKEAHERKNLYFIQLATSGKSDKLLIDLNIQNTETGRSISSMEVQIKQSEETDLILEHLQYQLFKQRQNQPVEQESPR